MATEVRVNPLQSRFGRIFDLAPRPDVAPFPEDLGMPGGPMDGGMGYCENAAIPAVMTYFSQFVDHDMTLDTTSNLERQNDPAATTNFRTPALALDNLYGLGPTGSPFLYAQPATHALKMLLGPALDHAAEVDLPRNRQGIALLGDPRNDDNLIVAQLHVAFLKLHNAMVDQLPRLQDSIEDASPFDKVQRLMRWHYQWLILHHFLPAIAGQEVIDAVRTGKRQLYRPPHIPFIPVEFSVAAYRFRHSMVQPGYGINDTFAAALFPEDPATPPAPPGQLSRDLRGGPIRFDERLNWKNFVDTGAPLSPTAVSRQSSLIDARLARALLNLPHSVVPPDVPAAQRSLAVRNLRRGVTMQLPSGQAVADFMASCIQIEPLQDADLWAGTSFAGQPAPLWYYILREADVQQQGRRLGTMGARIVVEVFLGLLQLDNQTFLVKKPDWTPIVEGRAQANDFTFVDLFRIAGTDIA
jgi:hypothetical protein